MLRDLVQEPVRERERQHFEYAVEHARQKDSMGFRSFGRMDVRIDVDRPSVSLGQ